MNGERSSSRKRPATAGLMRDGSVGKGLACTKWAIASVAVVALLLQVMLAAPLSARMMVTAPVCGASDRALGALAPDGQQVPDQHDQPAGHACSLCFAAVPCPLPPPACVALPLPRPHPHSAGSKWPVIVRFGARPSVYQPRAPPIAA